MWQINLLQLNLISVTFCSHVSSQIKSAYFSNQFSWKKRQICFYFKLLNVTHSRYCISRRGIFVCLFVCFLLFFLCCWSHMSEKCLSSLSRWLSSPFGRRRLRMSRTWYTFAERLRSCRPSATPTSSLYMKVRVFECLPVTNHGHLFNLNMQTKSHMSRILPSISSFSTRGRAVGLSCYDMQMS